MVDPEFRSCVKVEVAPSLISLMVFVDVKQHWNEEKTQKKKVDPTEPKIFDPLPARVTWTGKIAEPTTRSDPKYSAIYLVYT